ncbi:NAD-dependent succinate-semialdehyde dehydrogenase [Mycolicibacterium parafortuitum]|uniref:Succinate semialdehyde dehydrogenase [Saccharomonospora viridis DSM] n=1 Tax=Mycolicibacterium parafortuitum TaxID=39692 RepID=A0A375YJP9_MYCPF|nr:NAD-dependent succinate-semialdehyde dehydrogenase [Mycolicibacterium parafortuitum]ORB27925.1 NAD-dependent succinate-semialdehyde dehydrogenase [Mycolicibacterium parafortuitum]SRX81368.1 succinate semialdehyde dehydrogenase [Saccharomonospora viridis DSM] [Mycolicibacterium parafortuitum]
MTVPDTDALSRSEAVLAGLPTPAAGPAIEVLDPATEAVIATVPDAAVQDALDAVAAADEAGALWARTPARTRADVLRRWYELLLERAEDLAVLITREMGKPLAEARAEVTYGADFVRWYSEEAVRPRGDARELPLGGAQMIARRAPVGLSVLITPWNFPLAMATRKIAPALAAGCPVVIKPAALTPLTTILAVELARQAGVPDGLVNVVTTNAAPQFSEAVLRDPRVRKVSFTGSTPVGSTLLRLAAENVLRSSMELGGNAPLIVFDDADLDRAVTGAFQAKMRNGGQSCIAANRIFVQDGIADAFLEGLTEKMASVAVGNGLADGVGLGPLIDERAVASMCRLVADATQRGATIRTGGTRPDGPGYFYTPTVLADVPADAEVATTEIFGPIAAVQRFGTEDEVIGRANDTDLGLAGYVFTESLDRALNVADRLETGLVGINQGVPSNAAAPFGGIKQSGLGREGSAEGLEEYQSIRFYNIARRETH